MATTERQWARSKALELVVQMFGPTDPTKVVEYASIFERYLLDKELSKDKR